MKCSSCGLEIQDRVYNYGGQELCEDCYIDRMAITKTCDPWAVYTAKRTNAKDLTPLQKNIYELIKKNGPMGMEEICNTLSIKEEDFKNAFATLRHLELLKAFKEGDKVLYKLFDA